MSKKAEDNFSSFPMTFISIFRMAMAEVNSTARQKGWWKGRINEGELIALAHSELSEALEELRHGNPPSGHIAEFSSVEEEFADVIIRLMDHSAAKKYRLAEAIVAKIAYNKTRKHRRGGKKF